MVKFHFNNVDEIKKVELRLNLRNQELNIEFKHVLYKHNYLDEIGLSALYNKRKAMMHDANLLKK